MKLCSQLEGTLPSQMIAAARSRIMEASVSPAARIISTTMPDGPGALRESLLNRINCDWDGRAFHWWFIRQVVWVPVNVEEPLVVL